MNIGNSISVFLSAIALLFAMAAFFTARVAEDTLTEDINSLWLARKDCVDKHKTIESKIKSFMLSSTEEQQDLLAKWIDEAKASSR